MSWLSGDEHLVEVPTDLSLQSSADGPSLSGTGESL